MFHRITKLRILKGTALEATFQDGKVIFYDVSQLFDKYPILKALQDYELFSKAKMTAYGVHWSEALDLDAETIYEDGLIVDIVEIPLTDKIAIAIKKARVESNISQAKLSELTGIDQGDISKIECGLANPSISTLERILEALGKNIEIAIK